MLCVSTAPSIILLDTHRCGTVIKVKNRRWRLDGLETLDRDREHRVLKRGRV